jgi:hypothetical protein
MATQSGQGALTPVLCNRTKPPPATADADFIGINDTTTERYLCKGQSRNHFLPATEWICSHLAMACGMPVPPVAAVEIPSTPGVQYFGSQWTPGAIELALVPFGSISNPALFSTTFGFDVFVHNDDRHLGNYLYLLIAGDIVMRIIDFSRAWMHHGWPLPSPPLDPVCNTMVYLPIWSSFHPYTKPVDVLQRLRDLPDGWMQDVLAPMPAAWLDDANRLALEQWWSGAARQDRLNEAESSLP